MKRKTRVVKKAREKLAVGDRIIASLARIDMAAEANPRMVRGGILRCFLCGGGVELKLSRKQRPYYNCLDCYLQVFIRGDRGIKRLEKLVEEHGK